MHATMLLGGAYELGPVLGRGGMAEVREGWDVRNRRTVAVKTLYPQFAARSDLRKRFHTEAATMAALNHSHVVSVYDSGEHGGVPYIVMERLPGDSLAELIARGPLDPALVRSILDGVLGALSVSHGLGVLHRDIKPGNLLRAGTGAQFKLSDFGIAKTGAPSHTQVGAVFGTFAYLSPQRLSGLPATVADDLYAVGVLGYEALAGRHPFGTDENLGALVQAIMHGQRPPLRVVRPDADPYLTTVIERSLALDPMLRFGSADEMRAALHAPTAWSTPRQTLVYDGPPATIYPPPPVPRRGRTRAVLAAVATAAVLGAAGVAVAIGATSTPPPAKTVGTTIPSPVPSSSPVQRVAPTPVVPPVVEPPAPRQGPPAKKQEKPGHGGPKRIDGGG